MGLSLPSPFPLAAAPCWSHTNPTKSAVPRNQVSFVCYTAYSLCHWSQSLWPQRVPKATTGLLNSPVTSVAGWGNLFYRSSPTGLASMMRVPSTLWATAVLEYMPAWSAQTRSIYIPVRSRMVVCNLRYFSLQKLIELYRKLVKESSWLESTCYKNTILAKIPIPIILI